VRFKWRAFSSCADFLRQVLENLTDRQIDGFEMVGKVIHFSMEHYGYYEVCIYSFYKNSEYPSQMQHGHESGSLGGMMCSMLTFREHSTRNPDLARVFHSGVCGKGEYNQTQAQNWPFLAGDASKAVGVP
jgi:hypothetical protein